MACSVDEWRSISGDRTTFFLLKASVGIKKVSQRYSNGKSEDTKGIYKIQLAGNNNCKFCSY